MQLMKNEDVFLYADLKQHSYEDILRHILNRPDIYSVPEISNANLSLDTILIKPPTVLSISSIKKHSEVIAELYACFPGVFSPATIKSSYPADFYNRFKLKMARIPYSTSVDNQLILHTKTFIPLILHLQIIQYLITLNTFSVHSDTRFSHISEWYKYVVSDSHILQSKRDAPTLISLWLNEQIKEGYSSGELIDFIDRLYDQYKFTNISPQSFQIIFRCFGQHTIDIGNTAFDYFSETRDFYTSWEKSIDNFLTQKLFFSKGGANLISKELLKLKY